MRLVGFIIKVSTSGFFFNFVSLTSSFCVQIVIATGVTVM